MILLIKRRPGWLPQTGKLTAEPAEEEHAATAAVLHMSRAALAVVFEREV